MKILKSSSKETAHNMKKIWIIVSILLAVQITQPVRAENGPEVTIAPILGVAGAGATGWFAYRACQEGGMGSNSAWLAIAVGFISPHLVSIVGEDTGWKTAQFSFDLTKTAPFKFSRAYEGLRAYSFVGNLMAALGGIMIYDSMRKK